MGNGFLHCTVVIFSVVFSVASAQTTEIKKKSRSIEYKKGEVIVKLKPSKGQFITEAAHDLLWEVGKLYAVSLKPLQTDKNIVNIKSNPNTPMGDLINAIASNPNVEYAEPNYIYRIIQSAEDVVIPNDPSFNLDWGLLNTGQKDSKGQEGIPGKDSGAAKAWKLATGSKDLVVAVIDTGVDYNHEDLKDNSWTNTKEIPNNKKDDDGNGFVDDVHGWNFEGKNNDPMDDNKHGTHVSGTIGASGHNGVGTAGVNWNVSILGIKFLSAGGSGTLDDALESIKYATLMGAHIMSNSWGGGGFSQTMLDAINEAKAKGILFVAAAGNENNDNDNSPTYPGSYQADNVIAVAATDNRDQLARWSSYGQTSVHLSAPGVNVFSTVPKDKGGYDTFSGTSMATPHVSGAAALIWSVNRNWTYKQIKDRLLATVDPVRILKRKTTSGGRLNVYNAITNTIPPTNEPPANLWKTAAKIIETKHPYDNDFSEVYEITHPGAKYLRVHFKKIGVEKNYDFIRIKDTSGVTLEDITGEKENYVGEYVEGSTLKISFEADSSVNGYGFAIDSYDYIE